MGNVDLREVEEAEDGAGTRVPLRIPLRAPTRVSRIFLRIPFRALTRGV